MTDTFYPLCENLQTNLFFNVRKNLSGQKRREAIIEEKTSGLGPLWPNVHLSQFQYLFSIFYSLIWSTGVGELENTRPCEITVLTYLLTRLKNE